MDLAKKNKNVLFSGLWMTCYKLAYCYHSARLKYMCYGVLLSTKSSEKWHNVKGMSTSTPLSLGKYINIHTHQLNQYLAPD